jgi:hypothetical protein
MTDRPSRGKGHSGRHQAHAAVPGEDAVEAVLGAVIGLKARQLCVPVGMEGTRRTKVSNHVKRHGIRREKSPPGGGGHMSGNWRCSCRQEFDSAPWGVAKG